MQEQALERLFTRMIKNKGGKALKFTSPGIAGVPDRLVLLPGGQAVFVELKAPGRKMRPLQRKRAKQLRNLGFRVYCLDSVSAIERFLVEVFGEEVMP